MIWPQNKMCASLIQSSHRATALLPPLVAETARVGQLMAVSAVESPTFCMFLEFNQKALKPDLKSYKVYMTSLFYLLKSTK